MKGKTLEIMVAVSLLFIGLEFLVGVAALFINMPSQAIIGLSALTGVIAIFSAIVIAFDAVRGKD